MVAVEVGGDDLRLWWEAAAARMRKLAYYVSYATRRVLPLFAVTRSLSRSSTSDSSLASSERHVRRRRGRQGKRTKNKS